MKIKLQQTMLSCLAFLFIGLVSVSAQQKSLKSVQKLKDDNKLTSYQVNEERNTPYLLRFDGATTERKSTTDAKQLLREALGLSNDITLSTNAKLTMSSVDDSKITKYQEYYKGIKVEHGVYNVLTKGDKIQMIGMEHYDFSETITTTASMSEDAALQKAFDFVNATEYAWDMYSTLKMNETNPALLAQLDAAINSVYPQGELVIVDDYNEAGINLKLAYKFNVYAAAPLYRADIYIDANDGKMLLADMDIKHAAEINENMKTAAKMSSFAMIMEPATGIGDLRYAGRRNFETTKIPGATPAMDEYTLLGTINVDIEEGGVVSSLPIENETKSYDGVGGVPLNVGGSIPSYDITDGSSRPEESSFPSTEIGDNDWTGLEHYRDRFEGIETYPTTNETNNDDVALDAHWGSEIVLRYWGVRHNRYSWDGQGRRITSFVHYGDAYDNAFYSNGTMTYGDGSYQGGTNPNGSFAPLMSLDVAGHEIGHGVCDTTSGLVYARQSGGMNEGFSDVWAAAVENFAIESFDTDGTFAQRFQPYGIGEQIDERDGGVQPENSTAANPSGALRFMDDPNSNGDPDCVLGLNWRDTTEAGCPAPNTANDQCGVHTNSGVLNKWFYLLVEGSGQTYQIGLGKVAADNEINDNGDAYSVTGIGFEQAERIAFEAEKLLTPNAMYSEMREKSIAMAQSLYGAGSAQEEATTAAWFAVCVGNEYVRPEGDVVVFNADNARFLQERNTSLGCETSRTYTYSISATLVSAATTLTLDTSASTAVLGEDFDLSTQTIALPEGSGIYTFEVEVFDDAIIEDGEMISVSFDFLSETQMQTVSLIDDDITPKVGSSIEELVALQEFNSSDVPAGWKVNPLTDPIVNNWAFNGTGAPGIAYITDGTTEAPMYNGNGPGISQDGSSNTILMTPLINGLGLRDVRVEFDYIVGGEEDGGPSPLDYGELVYSFDGVVFTGVEKFAGPGGSVITGSFDDVIPEVENSQFIIGFRWLNDQLAGTAYSFSVDNVRVSAAPALVETQANTSQSHTVRQNNDIFFQTIENNNIVTRIENSSSDLGCVNVQVVAEGTSQLVEDNQVSVRRSSKVITINPDGVDAPTATYDITFYMTTAELENFDNINDLQIMKVEGDDIDAATNANTVFAGGLLEDLRDTEGYATFQGSFTGFSSFAISEDAVLSTNDFDRGTVALYPSPVTSGENVTITTQDLLIENATIFDVRGAQVFSKDFAQVDAVQLSTAGLQTGFYFVRLNNDTSKTFKFVVK